MARVEERGVNERESCGDRDDWSLDDLSVGVLEEILVDLMIVKYPGVEQSDIDRLLTALRNGDLDFVSVIEAGVAEKSARWMRAILDMDR
jgi:hypothetical protein